MITGSVWKPELEDIFRKRFGSGIHRCDMLSSHGSDRIILRLRSPHDDSAIGIISDHVEENRTFISFSNHFIKHKLNVPGIFGVSEDLTNYLIEDLGDETLFSLLKPGPGGAQRFSNGIISIYRNVIGELPRFQIKAGASVDYSLCYQFNEFGKDNIEQDLNYFKNMFLDKFTPSYDKDKLGSDLEDLKTELLKVPREYFLYRDFQSRNIMIKDGSPYFIDYQSGRRGALQYDLASLLYDARADMPQDIREMLLSHYLKVVTDYVKLDDDEFSRYFWYFSLVRILQAMGAYGFLGIEKRKKRFLDSIPYALSNANFILGEKIGKKQLGYLRKIFLKLQDERT